MTNVDIRGEHKPDVVSDATAYLATLPDNSVEFIYAGHFLEHLTREESRAFLHQARRVLGPEGVLQVTVPDISAALDLYKKGRLDYRTFHGAIYGALDNENEVHKQAFDADILVELCREYFAQAKKIKKSPLWVADVPWQVCYSFYQ